MVHGLLTGMSNTHFSAVCSAGVAWCLPPPSAFPMHLQYLCPSMMSGRKQGTGVVVHDGAMETGEKGAAVGDQCEGEREKNIWK